MITLRLDKNGGINKGDIKAFEHDNLSEVYIIQLYKNGAIYDLTNKSIELTMVERKRKIGDMVNLPIYEATEGKVKLEVVSDITKQDGIYDFKLTVKDTTGLIETFPNFQVKIENDITDSITGEIIQDPNFTILTDGLKALADYNIYKTNALKVPEIEKNIVDLTSQLDTKVNKNDLANGRVFKGSKTSLDELQLVESKNGDYWYIAELQHFYQYNGEKWIDIGTGDGGVQSINDRLNTVISNSYIVENITAPQFEIGGIGTNGNNLSVNNRIRSIDFSFKLNSKNLMLLKLLDNNYKYGIRLYDSNNSIIKSDLYTWHANTDTIENIYNINNYKKFKILIAKKDDSEILSSEITKLANVLNIVEINLNSLKNHILTTSEELKTLISNISNKNKIDRPAYYLGHISAENGNSIGSTNRIRSEEFYNKDGFIYIENTKPDLYKYTLRVYNSSGFIAEQYNWQSDSIFLNDIYFNNEFNKFKIVIAKKDDSVITDSEIKGIADSIVVNKLVCNKIDKMLRVKNVEIESGGLSTENGNPINADIRARTKFNLSFNSRCFIKMLDDKFMYILRYYKNGVFIKTDTEWRNKELELINNTEYDSFKIVFKKIDETTITDSDMREIQNNLYVSIDLEKKISLIEEGKINFEMTSIINPLVGLDRIKPQYLTLCAVKENITNGSQTKTVGWLYRDNVEPFNFYYASGNADNIRKIFTWKKEVTHDKKSLPILYSFGITEQGDVIAVYRGENVLQTEGNRQNPIIYPNNNYENPVMIDFSGDIPPTSWLQNSGCCSKGNDFYFCEYTRVYHDYAYAWKVTYPYTSKENWKKIKQEKVSGDWNIGFKHFHMIDIDPYSGYLYLSSGDDDSASKILLSKDNGVSWTQIAIGEKYCRQLNFIWLDDYIYWATDSGKDDKHYFFRAKRNSNDELDMSTVEDLYKFPNSTMQQATYHVCLIENPKGILILDRCDVVNNEEMYVYFWDIDSNKMEIINKIKPVGSSMYGFRCEAVNHYQSFTDDRIICGFSYFPNQLQIYDNIITNNVNSTTGAVEDDSTNEFKINNIAIRIKKY